MLEIERDHHGRITRIEIDPVAAGVIGPLLIAAAVALTASC